MFQPYVGHLALVEAEVEAIGVGYGATGTPLNDERQQVALLGENYEPKKILSNSPVITQLIHLS